MNSKESYLLYKGGGILTYASSIAATWVWAPAIFVASNMAYTNGLMGFLMFFIPNVFTLVMFGWFVSILRHHMDGFTCTDLFVHKGQKAVHRLVTLMLLVFSTCTQIFGLYTLVTMFFPDLSKLLAGMSISVLCFLYSFNKGVKSVIITDLWKYIVLLISGAVLIGFAVYRVGHGILVPHWEGVKDPEFWNLMKVYGIAQMVNLMMAPYADQSFWQRAYSIEPRKVFKTFALSAMLFAVIPLIFGFIGFMGTGSEDFSITTQFVDTVPLIFVVLAITAALVSTLDSNLCAISSIFWNDFFPRSTSKKYGILGMILLLIVANAIFVCTSLSLVQMTLIYGSARTACGIPTILVILRRYDATRLFYATLLAVLCGSAGYVTMVHINQEYAFIFTLCAMLIPLFGYKGVNSNGR